jgi:hypothetical protein
LVTSTYDYNDLKHERRIKGQTELGPQKCPGPTEIGGPSVVIQKIREFKAHSLAWFHACRRARLLRELKDGMAARWRLPWRNPSSSSSRLIPAQLSPLYHPDTPPHISRPYHPLLHSRQCLPFQADPAFQGITLCAPHQCLLGLEGSPWYTVQGQRVSDPGKVSF